jgi:hypothetical protein
MAKLVLTDASVTINSIALSDHANSVTLNYEIDSVETTAFGSVGHTFTGGLQNLSVEVSLMQDLAAANVEATIYPLVGTTTTLALKNSSAATSATNPLYTITGAYLASHTPLAGSVGELAMTTLTFTGGTIVKTTT